MKDVDQLGNYLVIGADADSKFESGFSVNADPRESNLNRLPESELESMLGGKERFSIARDIGSLQKKVHTGRVGREVFPMLLGLLLFIFVAEHLVANRFYESELPTGAKPTTSGTVRVTDAPLAEPTGGAT